MIDIENKIIDTVARAVNAQYPNAEVAERFNDSPASFPFVSVEEIDNSNPRQYQDNTRVELYSQIFYEVNICTNDPLKKSTAKAIAQIVDEAMNDMKLLRQSKVPTPNINRTVYRLTMRYRAIVGKGRQVGDNIVYQMYHQ